VNPGDNQPARRTFVPRPSAVLVMLAVFLIAACGGLAALSARFAPGSEPTERPIPAVLGLLGLATVFYLAAIPTALRVAEGRRLLGIILLASLLMRAAALCSWPIQEIDLYRYLWDGAVVLEGVSPYRYSPEQVLSAAPDGELPHDLKRLVELREGYPALGTILSRIHYGELPTIYPPTSQAVFAAAVFVTPSEANAFTCVVVIKTVLVLFDLATVLLVVALLRLAGKHIGWSVAYAWCPLVIKEFANSGHLDSVAMMLSVLALYLALRPLARGTSEETSGGWRLTGAEGGPSRSGGRLGSAKPQLAGCAGAPLRSGPASRRWHEPAAALVLALAVGAKIYPVVLLPVFFWVWRRTAGWRLATTACLVFLFATAALLWPMLPATTPEATATADPPPADGIHPPPSVDGALPRPPTDMADVAPQDPSAGLRAFLRRWEMNDFLFMLVVENLRSSADVEPRYRPWFSVVPESWRTAVLSGPSRWLSVDRWETAFLVARFATAAAFAVIALWLVWAARRSDDPAAWLRVAFLTLAWFWLLSPTQNPWYWTWALPLVGFARGRSWLFLSGLVMIYYLRFWLNYHWPEPPVLGTRYAGAEFFDFVVVWIEYGPWLAALGAFSLLGGNKKSRTGAAAA